MKKYESWDTFDFSNLSDQEITDILSKQNIPLSIKETKTVQSDFLKRPPTLAELVLFSIQGSEHSSYKSSKEHIKHFVTDGCLLYTSPSPRDVEESRMPSSA